MQQQRAPDVHAPSSAPPRPRRAGCPARPRRTAATRRARGPSRGRSAHPARVWIAVVAFCLIGLVATQVSLLKLNSGIGRAVQTASTLERSNASLRAEISRLSAGDRIQRLATAAGMVMPAPSDVTYLRAGDR